MPAAESVMLPEPSPDTRAQPAKARTTAVIFMPVSRSLKSSAEKSVTMAGAVYSRMAAAERLM